MKVTISRTIYIGSAMIIVVMVAVIISAIMGLSRITTDFKAVTDQSMPRIILLADVSRAMDVARIKQGLQVTGTSAQDARSVDKDITDNIAKADTGLAQYQALPVDEEEKAILASVATQWQTLRTDTMEVRRLALGGDIDRARALYRGPMVGVAVSLRKTITQDIAMNQAIARSRAKAANDTAQSTALSMKITGAIALLLCVGLAVVLRQHALQPIRRLIEAMGFMAGGELDHPVPGADDGNEIGQISQALAAIKQMVGERAIERAQRDVAEQKMVMEAFEVALERLHQQNLEHRIDQDLPEAYAGLRLKYNAAIASLADALSKVRIGSSNLVAVITELRSATNDLATRNERQAANVEETAAGMQHAVSGAKRTAGNSEEARIQAEAILSKVKMGGTVVTRAVEAMDAIEQSSAEIGQIISVIDGIAFQTNLLALNAGVEAARAGDAGKGFAVVANEVRVLAQRSAEAAKEIRQLIEGSNQHVSGGVDLVKQTGDLLTDILTDVGSISSAIVDIADLAGEQEKTLVSVNGSMLDIDTVTQQNAAMVEETNAAVRSMSEEVGELFHLVSAFKTRDLSTRPEVGGQQNRRNSIGTNRAARHKVA